MPKNLKLVDYNDPILHQKTIPVTFPLSEEIKQIIADMKYSIQPEQLKDAGAKGSAVGMAANQWGIDKNIFMYCPTGDTSNSLEVMINSSYQPCEDSEIENQFEGCFSIPLAIGEIKRFKSILVKYQNEQGEVIERQLDGWEARVWQHENDHVNGFLYDNVTAGKCCYKFEYANEAELKEFIEQRRQEKELAKLKPPKPGI